MPKSDSQKQTLAGLLEGLGEGAFHVEASEAFHELTKKLFDHAIDFAKAKGTMTITLAVEIDRDGVAVIDPDLKVKTPKPARRRGRYWLLANGDLSAENPKQQRLPLADVPQPKTRGVDLGDQPLRGV